MSLNSFADATKEATNKALEAYLEQSGTRKRLDDYFQSIEKQYVPPYIQKHGGIILMLYKAAHDNQLVCTWEW